MGKKKETITFHYLKSNNFIIHHIDGIYGGVTPKGFIGINFFSERFPIPKTVTQELIDGKQLGKEISIETKEGVIRQVECGVVMNIDTAKSIYKWLERQIIEYERYIKQEGGKE